ncbi:MAG TPA: M3 family metallopeptidase [Steroidobacteraceae bacterium]|jgi:peptidyl-dipeptidase Dcp
MYRTVWLASLSLVFAGPLPGDESPGLSPSPAEAMSPDNPFAEPSSLPYRLPPFDRIHDGDFRPAFLQGMASQRAEVDVIARDPQPPTFDNTVLALERSGRLLDRVATTFSDLSSANSDDAVLKIESEMSPKLAAHEDAILLDPALFARVDALYRQRTELHLDPESMQLLDRYHTRFVRAGAQLSDEDKTRLRGDNQQLSILTTHFRQNLLQASREGAIVVDRLSDLRGLSAEQIAAATQAAQQRGLTGHWLIALQNTTVQPLLANLSNRALRERIYRASIARSVGGDADNTDLIIQIVRLRAERARLLGYPNHAAYVLADETAGNPQAVDAMLGQLSGPALHNARQRGQQLQQLIDAEAAATHRRGFRLQPWDWSYYSEKLRKSQFEFDVAQVRPYFELDHVLQDGVFYAAHELYGLTFKERHDLPVYQSDVRVFEVYDADGSPLALFLADYYARDTKQGGAWMNSYVIQSKLFGDKPVVSNNLNIPKPAAGSPTLLTFDEVTGLFHEFGHALHGMFSNVEYPQLAGTRVPRDFVEYPSQFNEMWARNPEVLAHFARHFRSGEPMPKALLDKVLAAQNFDQGYQITEYVEAAVIDQAWHRLDAAQVPAADAVGAFEIAALRSHGFDYPAVPPRYHSTYFQHIFAGGYSAAYYAYLWSEVLARDTGAWMNAHGGLTRTNGDYLRATVLSRGRSVDPQTLFRDFYGGPPDIGPLLEYRGLRPTL